MAFRMFPIKSRFGLLSLYFVYSTLLALITGAFPILPKCPWTDDETAMNILTLRSSIEYAESDDGKLKAKEFVSFSSVDLPIDTSQEVTSYDDLIFKIKEDYIDLDKSEMAASTKEKCPNTKDAYLYRRTMLLRYPQGCKKGPGRGKLHASYISISHGPYEPSAFSLALWEKDLDLNTACQTILKHYLRQGKSEQELAVISDSEYSVGNLGEFLPLPAEVSAYTSKSIMYRASDNHIIYGKARPSEDELTITLPPQVDGQPHLLSKDTLRVILLATPKKENSDLISEFSVLSFLTSIKSNDEGDNVGPSRESPFRSRIDGSDGLSVIEILAVGFLLGGAFLLTVMWVKNKMLRRGTPGQGTGEIQMATIVDSESSSIQEIDNGELSFVNEIDEPSPAPLHIIFEDPELGRKKNQHNAAIPRSNNSQGGSRYQSIAGRDLEDLSTGEDDSLVLGSRSLSDDSLQEFDRRKEAELSVDIDRVHRGFGHGREGAPSPLQIQGASPGRAGFTIKGMSPGRVDDRRRSPYLGGTIVGLSPSDRMTIKGLSPALSGGSGGHSDGNQGRRQVAKIERKRPSSTLTSPSTSTLSRGENDNRKRVYDIDGNCIGYAENHFTFSGGHHNDHEEEGSGDANP